MSRIQKLPPALINKIAAGEVVERPASVVKELVENALDAGATTLELVVEGGGIRRLQLTDDGEGVAADELRLAVSSHATSKLRTADDLFAIGTLGFRGEALASIASVSHFTIASRPRRATGAELRVDGGKLGAPRPVGMPEGTRIEVADLFFNVPARRAFLRNEQTELRTLLGELKRQALARPDVHVRARSDGKPVIDAPAASDEPRERIAQLLGRELAQDLLSVPYREEDGIGLRGYVSPCDRSRGNSQQQFFFLNGRAIRDVTLLTAVKRAYDNLLPPRRHPSVLLWLELDPGEVDVNVHPQKAEVRFRRDREVFRAVVRALQATLREGGLALAMRLPRHRLDPAAASAPAARPPEPGLLPFAAFAGSPSPSSVGPAVAVLPPPAAQASAPVASAPAATAPAALGRFMQIHRRYVVIETEEGLRILDPHALHERILYEQIRERLQAGSLESQQLLFPQLVEASPEEALALEDRAEALAALGFEVVPFGQGALAVHAAPRLLAAERIPEALRGLLAEGARGELDPEERGEGGGLVHELAASLACRSAVRFGQALTDAEIAELLRLRPLVRRGHCCPHGRPTALALSLDDLDHRFGRQGAG